MAGRSLSIKLINQTPIEAGESLASYLLIPPFRHGRRITKNFHRVLQKQRRILVDRTDRTLNVVAPVTALRAGGSYLVYKHQRENQGYEKCRDFDHNADNTSSFCSV